MPSAIESKFLKLKILIHLKRNGNPFVSAHHYSIEFYLDFGALWFQFHEKFTTADHVRQYLISYRCMHSIRGSMVRSCVKIKD